ncbi:hypothetical protein D3C80_1858910 [compost metagenome]
MPYSAPTDNPCISRAITSSTGAATPTVAYVGMTAIINEPPHIMNTEMIIEILRPRVSAM